MEEKRTEVDIETLQAQWAIDALRKATEININVEGTEEGEDFRQAMRKLAEDIQQHSGLDQSVMDNYDAEIQRVKDYEKAPAGELDCGDVDNLMLATFDLCDSLGTAAEIMPRLRLMHDVMYLWGAMA